MLSFSQPDDNSWQLIIVCGCLKLFKIELPKKWWFWEVQQNSELTWEQWGSGGERYSSV